MLDKNNVQNTIDIISKKVASYKINPALLGKFSQSSEDQEFLSYANGVGGNYPKFLSLLIQQLQLKNIVELGNREGVSTLCIYDGLLEDGKFVSIDIERDQRYCPDSMFHDKRVQFVFGDVCDLSVFKEKIPTDIDLLFSDTIHYDFQLRDEWAIYQYLLADRALVAIDDININDKRSLFDELPYSKWDLTELCHVSGWGLFLFERHESMTLDERILAAYKASSIIWKRKYDELHAIAKKKEAKAIGPRIKKSVKQIKPVYAVVRFIKQLLGQ